VVFSYALLPYRHSSRLLETVDRPRTVPSDPVMVGQSVSVTAPTQVNIAEALRSLTERSVNALTLSLWDCSLRNADLLADLRFILYQSNAKWTLFFFVPPVMAGLNLVT
jgi:hypothetical protein